MSPEEMRAEFARLLELKPDYERASKTMEAELLAAQLAAVREKHRTMRVKDLKAAIKIDPELVKAVREPFEKRAAEWQRRAAELKLRRDALLDELAIALTPIVTPGQWTRVRTFFSSSYASQGMGAASYARGRAEMAVIELQAAGLPTRIISEDVGGIGTEIGRLRWTNYHLEVEGALLDYEIANRRPGMTLVEWVQACYDQCCDPRVYMPMLAHGFEEKHGIVAGRIRRR